MSYIVSGTNAPGTQLCQAYKATRFAGFPSTTAPGSPDGSTTSDASGNWVIVVPTVSEIYYVNLGGTTWVQETSTPDAASAPTTSTNALTNLFTLGTAIGRNIAAGSQQNLVSSSNPLATQTAGTAVAGTPRNITTNLSAYRTGFILLSMSVNGGSTGTGAGSMTIILQGSPDGGNTWSDLASFPATTPSIPNPNSKSALITLNEYGAQTTAPAWAAAAPGSMAAGTAYTGGPWGDRLRIWENVTAAYTTAPTYSVLGFFKS